jgi:hypothetical protein
VEAAAEAAPPWAEYVPLLHAALSRGHIKAGNWELAKRALRAWKAQSIANQSFGAQAQRLTVPVAVGNSLLRAAARARQLSTFLEAMETLGAVGCPPNADTYELVSQTAVQSIRFMLGAVSVRTRTDESAHSLCVGLKLRILGCRAFHFHVMIRSISDGYAARGGPAGSGLRGAVQRGQVEPGEHGGGAARHGVHLQDTGQDPAVQLLQRIYV